MMGSVFGKHRNLFVLMFSLIFFLLLIMGMILIFVVLGNTEEENQRKYQYQVFEFNPLTNSTRTTIVKTNRKLKEDIYYSNNGLQFVITKFEGSTYRCHGQCYCKSERRTVLTLSRGLYVLVAAISLTFAMKTSEGLLLDQCVERYSNDCDENLIFAETDSCDSSKAADDVAVSEVDDSEVDDKLGKTFNCKGNCIGPWSEEGLGKTLQKLCLEEYGECESIEFGAENMFMERPYTENAYLFFTKYIMVRCSTETLMTVTSGLEEEGKLLREDGRFKALNIDKFMDKDKISCCIPPSLHHDEGMKNVKCVEVENSKGAVNKKWDGKRLGIRGITGTGKSPENKELP